MPFCARVQKSLWRTPEPPAGPACPAPSTRLRARATLLWVRSALALPSPLCKPAACKTWTRLPCGERGDLPCPAGRVGPPYLSGHPAGCAGQAYALVTLACRPRGSLRIFGEPTLGPRNAPFGTAETDGTASADPEKAFLIPWYAAPEGCARRGARPQGGLALDHHGWVPSCHRRPRAGCFQINKCPKHYA